MAIADANTANTLSIRFRPGEEKRIAPSKSEAIFTFGDFNIQRDLTLDTLSSTTRHVQFGSFSTLESLSANNITIVDTTFIHENELKFNKTDPKSYAYFGSFYSEVNKSINDIIVGFPYAVLSYDGGSGTTIYDYSQDFNNLTNQRQSTFKVPFSAITNQGGIIFNSGNTRDGVFSLVNDIDKFAIQISGYSSTEIHNIVSYSFSAGSYLQFTIAAFLLTGTSVTASTVPVYIRPTSERFTSYKNSLSSLQTQLLFDSDFDVPDLNLDDGTEITTPFIWPKTIDGFAPDSFGDNFESYQTNILQSASDIDSTKTNILARTVIGDNFIELDSVNQVYSKVVQSYAHQFDLIKRYIDGIAYAHSITYNGAQNVPNKFLKKFSQLLGWKLSDSFNEVDFFEFLSGDEDGQGNSLSHFNIEIWKRILININWLFKKKGTRDALLFIFKLIGAPDCLIELNEFVYDIQQTLVSSLATANTLTNTSLLKINDNGYVNYNGSQFVFQEGGIGRGDGQSYIQQWKPEFDPIKVIDNEKVHTGNTVFFGTENVINTKELNVTLTPATAIECDVKSWYTLSGTCWVWGSLAPPFSANTTPFYYTIPNCELVAPDVITGMTLNEYIDFIYSSNVSPTNRKTNSQSQTSWHYPELRRIYLNYYLLSEPRSHQLTFRKLESFLRLLEVQIQNYALQLIPSTTIPIEGTVYRNTVFNRQRFVYKEGVNAGSEFKVSLPPSTISEITPITINSVINRSPGTTLLPVFINASIINNNNIRLNTFSINARVNSNNFVDTIDVFTINSNLGGTSSMSLPFTPPFIFP